jgi:hypothetical protein
MSKQADGCVFALILGVDRRDTAADFRQNDILTIF